MAKQRSAWWVAAATLGVLAGLGTVLFGIAVFLGRSGVGLPTLPSTNLGGGPEQLAGSYRTDSGIKVEVVCHQGACSAAVGGGQLQRLRPATAGELQLIDRVIHGNVTSALVCTSASFSVFRVEAGSSSSYRLPSGFGCLSSGSIYALDREQ